MIDLASLQIDGLLKIGVLAVIFLYAVFAFVVVTQIITMNRLIQQPPIGKSLELIGWIHLLLAASLFLIGLAIL